MRPINEMSLMCLLDYCIQQDQGDPSPAHTLAARYGISPRRSVSGSVAGGASA